MTNEKGEHLVPPPSWKNQGYIPIRYLMVMMTLLGSIVNFWLRSNMNFAIVTMVSSSGSNSTNGSDVKETPCGFNISQEAAADYDGEFDWDEWIQGMIMGSFYWGYVWTQLPGGYLAEIIGGRYVFGGSIALEAVITLLMPLAANIGYVALICARVALGLCGGAVYPSMNVFISCWAPPQERTLLITICQVGSSLSLTILYPFLTVLIRNIGWEAAFYVPAAITLAWFIVWFIVVSDSPHNHRWITSTEKDYIISSIGETKSIKRPAVPWRAILTSMPFWALIIAQFGDAWGYFLLITDLPLYMKEILGEDLSSNAFWNSLPNVGSMVLSLTAASIGDMMLRRQTVSRGILRKGMHFLGQISQGVCMLTLSFLMCDRSTAHWVFFVSLSCGGFANPGYLANYMDLAPNFTGTIVGIGNAIGTTTGWLAPMTTGFLVNNQQTLGQWRKVWYVAAGMFLGNLLVYLFLGSGEVQQWNYVKDEQAVQHGTSDGHIGNKINKVKQQQGIKTEDQQISDIYSTYVTDPNFRHSRINKAFEEN